MLQLLQGASAQTCTSTVPPLDHYSFLSLFHACRVAACPPISRTVNYACIVLSTIMPKLMSNMAANLGEASCDSCGHEMQVCF